MLRPIQRRDRCVGGGLEEVGVAHHTPLLIKWAWFRYDERIDRVETRIAARLRDQLGSARNANEMFRIFSRYNALFVRPHIRGAIREYQTQLIQRVKEDIEKLHIKFKVCGCMSVFNPVTINNFNNMSSRPLLPCNALVTINSMCHYFVTINSTCHDLVTINRLRSTRPLPMPCAQ